jgi:hypothetical protein
MAVVERRKPKGRVDPQKPAKATHTIVCAFGIETLFHKVGLGGWRLRMVAFARVAYRGRLGIEPVGGGRLCVRV